MHFALLCSLDSMWRGNLREEKTEHALQRGSVGRGEGHSDARVCPGAVSQQAQRRARMGDAREDASVSKEGSDFDP